MPTPFSAYKQNCPPPVQNPLYEEIPPLNLQFPNLSHAPKFSALVYAVQRNTGAQIELIADTALAVMAASVQGHANVELFPETKTPLSLSIYGIGPSGSGKTTVENQITKPVKAAQRKAESEFRQLEVAYKCKLEIHKSKKQEFKKNIRKLAGAGADTDELEQQMLELAKEEPTPPPRPQILIEASTSLGLRQALYNNPLSVFQLSSEGGNALGSGALCDFPLQNAGWGGEQISRDTATTGNQTIYDSRLTSLILIQSEVHQKHFESNDQLARHSGYQARALNANYDQVMRNFSNGEKPDMSSYQPFYERVTELLGSMFEVLKLQKKEHDRFLIKFVDEAKFSRLGTRNSLVQHSLPGGLYEFAKDHAAKLPENIARVAAVIHYFEGFEGKISHQTVNLAKQIVFWHSFQFLNHFVPKPKSHLDAADLHKWIHHQIISFGFRFLRTSRILQYGPNGLRKRNALREAIEILTANKIVSEIIYQRPNGKAVTVIDTLPMNPEDNARLYNEIEIKPRYYD